jgi:flagellar biogenesis protein FliO
MESAMSAETIPPGVGAVSGEIIEYLKVIAILGVVIVFAFIALRFWLPKFTGIRATTNGPIHVVWRLALEPRKTLYIVRAGSDYVLLASSDAGVQLLTPLDAAKTDAALQEASIRPTAAFEFASLLRSRRTRRNERAE